MSLNKNNDAINNDAINNDAINNDAINNEKTIVVYRYKLSDDIMKEITNFAKIHQYDDRVSYKESWAIWYKANEDYLNREVNRLVGIGYEGSVEDKMFKAGRYYFRKKGIKDNADIQSNNDKKQRRDYISTDYEVIDAMDAHIKSSMNQNEFTPAWGYNDFCQLHINLLRIEILRICEDHNIKSKEISDKIKKTYKNRYYLLSRA
jgi:hypothetical protein